MFVKEATVVILVVAFFSVALAENNSDFYYSKGDSTKMTPQEISHLAHQEEALQISGAFSIEGEGGKMVQKIDGDYNNVIGLPLFQLKKMLKTVSYHHISSRTSS